MTEFLDPVVLLEPSPPSTARALARYRLEAWTARQPETSLADLPGIQEPDYYTPIADCCQLGLEATSNEEYSIFRIESLLSVWISSPPLSAP